MFFFLIPLMPSPQRGAGCGSRRAAKHARFRTSAHEPPQRCSYSLITEHSMQPYRTLSSRIDGPSAALPASYGPDVLLPCWQTASGTALFAGQRLHFRPLPKSLRRATGFRAPVTYGYVARLYQYVGQTARCVRNCISTPPLVMASSAYRPAASGTTPAPAP
jgi:hypothetical protein